VKKLNITNIGESPVTVESYKRPFSFSVKKGNTALLESLSQGLSIVDATSQYRSIYDKWFGVLAPRGVPWKSVLKYIAGVVVASALVGMVLLVWSLSLRKMVKQRTITLESEIAVRKQTEAALGESEERFRLAMEAANDGVWDWDLTNAQVIRSEAFFPMLGYKPEEFPGRVGDWQHLVHPDDLRTVQQELDECLAGNKEAHEVEFRVRTKSGDTVWILSRGKVVVRDENGKPVRMVGTHTDITERKKTEEQIEKQASLMESLLEAIPAPVFYKDTDHVYLGCNDAFVEFIGLPKENIVGKSVFAVATRELAEIYKNHDEALFQNPGAQVYEGSVEAIDGSTRNVMFHKAIFTDASGEVAGLIGVILDITDRKKAEEALRQSEERFRKLFEQAPMGMGIVGSDGRFHAANFRLCQMLGYTQDELTKLTFGDITHPDHFVQDIEPIRRLYAGDIPYYQVQKRYLSKDGDIIWGNLSVAIIRDPQGKALYTLPMIEDITERKKVEGALRESESKYKELVDNANSVIIRWKRDGTITFFNEYAQAFFGYSADEAVGKHVSILVPERDSTGSDLSTLVQDIVDYPDRYVNNINENVCHDGRRVWMTWTNKPIFDDEGQVVEILAVGSDITDRKMAEQELLASETRYRRLFEAAKDGILILDAGTGQIVDVNPFLAELLGYSRDKMLGKKLWEIGLFEDTSRSQALFAELQGKEYVRYEDLPLQTLRGEVMDVEFVSNVYLVDGTKVIQCNIRDITERRRTEKALRDSERKYRTLFEDSIDALYLTMAGGTLIDANQAFLDLLGYEKEEMVGHSVLKTYADPADRQRYYQAIGSKGFIRDYPLRLVRKDGREIDCLVSSRIEHDKDGSILISRGLIRDITEQRNLQRQLLQAQKMEAIGTLAGGIAHDFNNLLQVVLGYSELLLTEKREDDREYADLQKIFHAAKNGADLVQRLLMFSRKSEPKFAPMNLKKLIVQVEKLLRRTIPRMVDIHLDLSADLPEIYADSSQMEQVLMNLAVNARDAIPDLGKLTVKTSTVTLDEEYCRLQLEASPGEYVLLEVTDTGHGMDKATAEHIFEPFFTTKEMGRGTGLGLAMVHGIVKQHNGHITVYSEVGKGTTFRVYLPAIEAEVETHVETTCIMPALGTETVLLVDDEEFVKELGQRLLARSGYTVLTATNGEEALDLYVRMKDQIHLVILDLIMPTMGGRDCLKRLLEIDPQAKVLIASGYSADASTKECVDLGAKGFLAKPFRFKELMGQVRKVLDET
jgi:two-component system, cell cycle sensor histidine kinase and response regulator CckA